MNALSGADFFSDIRGSAAHSARQTARPPPNRNEDARRVTLMDDALGAAEQRVKIEAAVRSVNQPWEFVCGLHARLLPVRSTIECKEVSPFSLLSLCRVNTPHAPLTRHATVFAVKEVQWRSELLPHIPSFAHDEYRVKRIASMLSGIQRLQEMQTATSGSVAVQSKRNASANASMNMSHEKDSESSSIGASTSRMNLPSFAEIRDVALLPDTNVLLMCCQYYPCQSLELLLQQHHSSPPGSLAHPGATSTTPLRHIRVRLVSVVVKSILVQVARAIKALHAAHMPHQHIRPSSVLVIKPKPHHVWIDNVGALNTRTPLNDPDLWRWYAPEVTVNDLLHAECTPLSEQDVERWMKCDIFSVGLLLYFVLTGRRPFAEDVSPHPVHVETDATVAAMIGRRSRWRAVEDGQGLDGLDNTSLQSDLVSLAKMCLHKDPEVRPSAARVLQIVKDIAAHPDVAVDDEVAQQHNHQPPGNHHGSTAGPTAFAPTAPAPSSISAAFPQVTFSGTAQTQSGQLPHQTPASVSLAAAQTSGATRPLESGTSQVAAANASELNLQGCSQFLNSQYDAMAASDSVRDVQQDATELTRRVARMCFPEDVGFFNRSNPLTSVLQRIGRQEPGNEWQPHKVLMMDFDRSLWYEVAEKFFGLAGAGYYPRRELLSPLFRNHSAIAQQVTRDAITDDFFARIARAPYVDTSLGGNHEHVELSNSSFPSLQQASFALVTTPRRDEPRIHSGPFPWSQSWWCSLCELIRRTQEGQITDLTSHRNLASTLVTQMVCVLVIAVIVAIGIVVPLVLLVL